MNYVQYIRILSDFALNPCVNWVLFRKFSLLGWLEGELLSPSQSALYVATTGDGMGSERRRHRDFPFVFTQVVIVLRVKSISM